MNSHYHKTKVVKMGQWSLFPLDCETWFSESASQYFKKQFGIEKGLLIICTLNDGMEHAYIPENYFSLLFNRINSIKSKDYKNLEKILKDFYTLNLKIKKSLKENSTKDYTKLSNKQLLKFYKTNRDLIHQITVFDQFGWLAEEYWSKPMDNILTKAGLVKNSENFNKALFTLTKPEKISTTLEEKRSVLKEALKVINKKSTVIKSATILAKEFGWMPVFCFGNPWETEHYITELNELINLPKEQLQNSFNSLKNYSQIRNSEIKVIVKKYNINSQELQVFVDFGLALDARNEAEYCVSYGGYFLMPMYKEIARRLFLTTKQLRLLLEFEVEQCLLGKLDAQTVIENKGSIVSWGYNEKMDKRTIFSSVESKNIFNFVESYVKPVQGGNQSQGICASPGIVKGKIRIVPSPEQNNKVKKGDILVTYATTVDYLPAMKHAAAIITEVGGLTCHAAVVSREFSIPCIVALAGAMKNFKDGDLVEVDANKGTVKRI